MDECAIPEAAIAEIKDVAGFLNEASGEAELVEPYTRTAEEESGSPAGVEASRLARGVRPLLDAQGGGPAALEHGVEHHLPGFAPPEAGDPAQAIRELKGAEPCGEFVGGQSGGAVPDDPRYVVEAERACVGLLPVWRDEAPRVMPEADEHVELVVEGRERYPIEVEQPAETTSLVGEEVAQPEVAMRERARAFGEHWQPRVERARGALRLMTWQRWLGGPQRVAGC